MRELPPDLPDWCYTSSVNAIREMQSRAYPYDEVPLLNHRGVYYSDLIAAAGRRDAENPK